jgi:tyrosyl-tRNA synthetase
MGRELQKKMNDREKYVLTVPMILGTDGKQMSKTSGNCIWISDTAEDMYGKLMGMHDDQILPYAELVSSMSMEEVEELSAKLGSGANPRDVKATVAAHITSEYHDGPAADEAARAFTAQFSNHELPTDIPEFRPEATNVVELLVGAGLAKSKNEARTFVSQGSVKINQKKFTGDIDAELTLSDGDVVQVGKRRFIKIKM